MNNPDLDPFKIEVNYKKKPCMKIFKMYFRKADMFAPPITLRYKSDKKFYTNWGAFLTIIIGLTAFGLFFYDFWRILNQNADGLSLVESSTPTAQNRTDESGVYTYDYDAPYIFGFQFRDTNTQNSISLEELE